MSLLASDTPSLRICAVEALADIGDPQAIPALVKVLEQDDLSVKRAAFAGLQRLGWSPPDANRRARIAIALEEWWQLPEMGPVALPVLMDLLDDDTRSNQALYAIEQILQGDEAAVMNLDLLQKLAALMNAPARGSVQGRLPQGGKALQAAVARRRVSQLARALLQKRGTPTR
jgi:HEAT repeat protein